MAEVRQGGITWMTPAGSHAGQIATLPLQPLVECPAPGNGQQVRFDLMTHASERLVAGVQDSFQQGDVPPKLALDRADQFSYLSTKDFVVKGTC